MKALPGPASVHIHQEVQTLCRCWRIVRQDGVVLGFTDHHEDLEISGLTYSASTGLVDASAMSSSAGTGIDNLDVQHVLDAGAISKTDAIAGRYDGAKVYTFLVDYTNPTAWMIKLLSGSIGEVTVSNLVAYSELRSLSQQLRQTIGRTHDEACPYDLGDYRCQVNRAAYTATGTVTTVMAQHAIVDTARTEPAAYYTGGRLKFTSGLNAGLWAEVAIWNESLKQIYLHLDMPFKIEVGDDYEITAGCDKTWFTCLNRFGNMNYGGFPHIPGTDFLLSFSGNPVI